MADGKLVIVTGAAENHARPLRNLLASTDHYEPDTKVVVYDLGLSEATLALLRRQRRIIVPFRFADYPPHVGADRLRNYAWKPAMVHEVLQREGMPLLYLDAGDLVHGRLDRVRAELARTGFYSPVSSGTIVQWCHPATLDAMGAEPEILGDRNRNAAIIGFGTSEMAREIEERWYACAMRPEIICPPGATREGGHRFDQSVLSVLAARARRRYGVALTNDFLDLSHHNDSLTARQARRSMKRVPARGRPGSIVREGGKRRRNPAHRLWRAAKRAWRGIKALVAGS